MKNNIYHHEDVSDKFFMEINVFFSGPNNRQKDIIFKNNTFKSINGSSKSLINIVNESPGSIYIENNQFTNLSSSEYLLSLSTNDGIFLTNNSFSRIEAGNNGLIVTEKASSITVSALQLSYVTQSVLLGTDSLINIRTADQGS